MNRLFKKLFCLKKCYYAYKKNVWKNRYQLNSRNLCSAGTMGYFRFLEYLYGSVMILESGNDIFFSNLKDNVKTSSEKTYNSIL